MPLDEFGDLNRTFLPAFWSVSTVNVGRWSLLRGGVPVLDRDLFVRGIANKPSSESSESSFLVGCGDSAKDTLVSLNSRSGPYDFLLWRKGRGGASVDGLTAGEGPKRRTFSSAALRNRLS